MAALRRSTHGFTLIELIVSMTIFGILMASIFMIYSNIVSANKRLELTRALQENVRIMTEAMAMDVREKGVDFDWYRMLPSVYGLDYSGSGNTILAITGATLSGGVSGGTRYSAIDERGMPCTPAMMADISKNCYLGVERGGGRPTRLGTADVKLRDLRFYISGQDLAHITGADSVAKVTIVFELGIAAGRGLISRLVEPSYVRIETTINERPYKSS